MVGLGRLELPTLRLSGVRSNHLSYRPMTAFVASAPGSRLHHASDVDAAVRAMTRRLRRHTTKKGAESC